MFETLTTQLDTILDQLTLLVEKNFSTLVEPVLLVHPPNRRNAHVSFLQTRQDALGSLLSSIHALEKKTASIRVNVYAQQRACRLAQSPVSVLPNELLCSIFAFAFAAETSYSDRMRLSINPPFTTNAISGVCRQWRLAATSLRTMWTDIHLSTRSLLFSDSKFTRLVVDRITLLITADPDEFMSEHVAEELRRRLRTLLISSSEPADTFASLTEPKGWRRGRELVALESLELLDIRFGDSPQKLGRVILPALRKLRLCGQFMFAQLRAEQLTYLELSYQNSRPFGDIFLAFLRNTPRIRSIVLDFIDTCIYRAAVIPVVLEDLRRLEIGNGSAEVFMGILRSFRAPHLETFITVELGEDDSAFGSEDGDSDGEGPSDGADTSFREKFRRALGELVRTCLFQLISSDSFLILILEMGVHWLSLGTATA